MKSVVGVTGFEPATPTSEFTDVFQHIFHDGQQMVRIAWAGFKVEMCVKPFESSSLAGSRTARAPIVLAA
jgi:hypothetical protein